MTRSEGGMKCLRGQVTDQSGYSESRVSNRGFRAEAITSKFVRVTERVLTKFCVLFILILHYGEHVEHHLAH